MNPGSVDSDGSDGSVGLVGAAPAVGVIAPLVIGSSMLQPTANGTAPTSTVATAVDPRIRSPILAPGF